MHRVAPIAFLHELCCMGRIQEHCIKPTGQTIAVFFADRRAQACRPCNPWKWDTLVAAPNL